MTPYFDDGQIQIWHGDCREVLPSIPAGSVDLVLTDPPYGMAFGGFRGVDMNVKADGARQGIRLVRQAMFEMRDALAEDAHLYMFCHWESWPDFYDALSPSIPIKSALMWWKNRGGMGDTSMEYARDYEVILFGAFGRRPLRGKRDGAVIAGYPPEGNIKNRDHPTQKPVALLQYLVGKSCPPNGMVLDPFMGSGTTIRAARANGCRAIGIEISEEYCEIAVKRLQQSVLPLGDIA
jgi:DNA modification methylase